MCFVLAEHSKRLIADKDITCYKILIKGRSGKILAPYHTFFEYVSGVIYKLLEEHGFKPTSKFFDENQYIDYGFHSYRVNEIAEMMATELNRYNAGYHFVVDGIIPKGSVYYANNDEYVSNQLMVKYEKDLI